MGAAVLGGAGGFGGRGAGVWWVVGGGLEGVSGLESGLLIWVLCPLSAGFWGGQGGVALRALGGVWSACGVLVGRGWVLWAGAEECGSDGAGAGIIEGISADLLLTDDRPQRPDARSREVGVGHTEDFAVGGGGYGEQNPSNQRTDRWTIQYFRRKLLTDFTSNPATPTKTNNTKGSAMTLFYCCYFPPFFP